MKNNCTCKYCQNLNYDNSEYFVNLKGLARQRPVGVSGLLRVKNDAEFLALCIDSCIDALDELIIVYQDCDDNSPLIIEQKRLQYPDKIRTYFYRPVILSHQLTEEELKYALALPTDSIHLLSNYYNYTLSKASYQYAMKIDADQIYFTGKLKSFCDAYRKEKKEKITLKEFWAAQKVHYFADLINLFPKMLSAFSSSDELVDLYKSYTLKKIGNKKYPVSFSGINLYSESGKWVLPLGGYEKGMFLPFNGIHDTYLFEVSALSYYIPQPAYGRTLKYQNSLIESFSLNKRMNLWKGFYKHSFLYGGFLWYHMAAFKEPGFTSHKESYKNHTLPLFGDRVVFSTIETRLFPYALRRWMRPWYYLFWNKEQAGLPQEYIPEIEKVLRARLNTDSNEEK